MSADQHAPFFTAVVIVNPMAGTSPSDLSGELNPLVRQDVNQADVRHTAATGDATRSAAAATLMSSSQWAATARCANSCRGC